MKLLWSLQKAVAISNILTQCLNECLWLVSFSKTALVINLIEFEVIRLSLIPWYFLELQWMSLHVETFVRHSYNSSLLHAEKSNKNCSNLLYNQTKFISISQLSYSSFLAVRQWFQLSWIRKQERAKQLLQSRLPDCFLKLRSRGEN